MSCTLNRTLNTTEYVATSTNGFASVQASPNSDPLYRWRTSRFTRFRNSGVKRAYWAVTDTRRMLPVHRMG